MDYGFIPNLHVILLGDSQRAGAYLPYGKQLVRQLLASRQPYGKRVGRPESGIMVEAWVSGDHRWVRITAEGCGPFLMESGIIGLQNIGFTVAHLNDGLMHYNTAIRAYAADKKLLGMLTKLPATDSRPTTELHPTLAMSAEVDEEGKRDVDSETLLGLKKFCAARVPPSVFTGKLRLYFQAHYGKLLRGWNFRANLANHPPSLDWLGKLGDDEYLFQFHSAHTGIFTDSAKRHWLVQLGVKGAISTPNQANVFLMRASECVEAMRPMLLDPDVSVEDKERIEAYILAASYPDPSYCISKPVSVPTVVNFGYGWHFNWSGTAADNVDVATIHLGGVEYKHQSTHYRIAIARHDEYVDEPTNTELENEARRWTFELQQVEQKDWKNSKWQEVIAYPAWDQQKLEVFGAMWGERYGDGAPLYVFYNRDDLKVARYSSSGGESNITSEYTSSPPWFMGYRARGPGTPGFPCGNYLNVGTHASSATANIYSADDRTVQFSCGGAAVGDTARSYTYSRIDRSSISIEDVGEYGGYGGYIPDGSSSDVPSGAANVVTGADGCYVSHTTGYTTVNGPAAWNWRDLRGVYSVSNRGGTHSDDIKLLFVVPFADAEAAYLWGQKVETETESGTSGQQITQAWHLGDVCGVERITGPFGTIDVEKYTTALASTGPTAFSDARTETVQLGAYFVSGNGTLSFDPGSAVVSSQFFAGEPLQYVDQQFWTRTSAGLYRDTDGAGADLTGGYDAVLNGKPYVFSGWA